MLNDTKSVPITDDNPTSNPTSVNEHNIVPGFPPRRIHHSRLGRVDSEIYIQYEEIWKEMYTVGKLHIAVIGDTVGII